MYYAKNVRGALLIGCLYRGTQKPKIKISVAAKVSFPTPPRGAGVDSPYNGLYGKVSPERGSFFSPHVHGGGDFISSVCERPKWLTHAFNGCEKDKLTWFSDLFIFTKKKVHLQQLKGIQSCQLGM